MADDHVWHPDRAISEEGVITRVLNCVRCHLIWWPWESKPHRACVLAVSAPPVAAASDLDQEPTVS